MRRASLVVLTIITLAGCVNPFVRSDAQTDARNGAALGMAIGGPQAAAITSGIFVIIGTVARAIEKKRDRRKHERERDAAVANAIQNERAKRSKG